MSKNYRSLLDEKYKYGFITNIKSRRTSKGISKSVIRSISEKKLEPKWMLKKRALAFEIWLNNNKPKWPSIKYPKINFQNIHYYSEPKKRHIYDSINDDNLMSTYKKLGISINEKNTLSGVAVDVVFDSISVITTYKDQLKKLGVVFCSISEAIIKYPELVKKYFGSVVSIHDNFFAALNTAVFSDGTFIYIPKYTKCPIELSTYFRINEINTGQFERTLIIADKGSKVSYLEGCSAPIRKTNQLHSAVVELIALENAEIKYSTIQNWYPGNKKGRGGVYNFVTKRGLCKGKKSKISWTQLETGSAITCKYPSCVLKGDESIGEFYSISLTKNKQQYDTGTKMIHIGKGTKSTIISKSISTNKSSNVYRSLVNVTRGAKYSKNFTQCDSLLLGSECCAITLPYITLQNGSSITEHEASISKINERQIEYCKQRGISFETTIKLVVNGFCSSVIEKLPTEFGVEARTVLNNNII